MINLRLRAALAVAAVGAAVSLASSVASAGEARVVLRGAEDYPAGTIVIRAREKRLYYTLGDGTAIRYPVAVAKHGKEWQGYAKINGKYLNPDWAPPPVVKRDHPELPSLIKGGSPGNPMGVAALTLDRDEIAIHGTTNKMRASVGTSASYGCIRMLNEDVSDLFSRVSVGTPVVMVY
ncbi:MAG: L,D-transpeptidase [Methylobacteriaceae bacterium]|nr:L,D-transpeptidase [Methylobacteriaceae bacterium]